MARPHRRSSRIQITSQQHGTKPPSTPAQLANGVERGMTPENQHATSAIAASAPPKVSNSTIMPGSWSTPPSRSALKPDFDEMRPSRAQGIGAKSKLSKRPGIASIQTNLLTPSNKDQKPVYPLSAPSFEFKFKRPSTELSSEAQKLMNELRGSAARFKQELVETQQHEDDQDMASPTGRRFANAKGKIGRYSDVHMKEFKKMSSIANHPSSFRADPLRTAKPTPGLKRSNSRADLDKAGIGLGREVVTASSEETNDDGPPVPAKRMKRTHVNALPTAKDLAIDHTNPSKIMFPNVSHLPIPKSASLTRSGSIQSDTSTKSTVNNVTHLTSRNAFATPQPIRVVRPSTSAGARARSAVTHKFNNGVKSILRRPQIKFSNDPEKLAAGTHLSTPKINKDGPLLSYTQATAARTPSPQKSKSVVFSPNPDTIFRLPPDPASSPQAPSTPTPVKLASPGNEDCNLKGPTISYPTLSPLSNSTSSVRPTSTTAPADFTFRANQMISFSPHPKTPTIRHVRPIGPPTMLAFSSSHKNKELPSVPHHSTNKVSATPAHKQKELPNVLHGLSNKKRKRDSADVGSKDDADTDSDMNVISKADEDKENAFQNPFATKKTPNAVAVPTKTELKETAKAKAKANPSTQKKARLMTIAEKKPDSAQNHPIASTIATRGKRLLPLLRNRTTTSSSSALTQKPKSATKPKARGVLSLSRLNALAQPKSRS